jgi:hypothetical protein
VGVDGSERLVEQEHVRPEREDARDCCSLFLPSRKPKGRPTQQVAQSQCRSELLYPSVRGLL